MTVLFGYIVMLWWIQISYMLWLLKSA